MLLVGSGANNSLSLFSACRDMNKVELEKHTNTGRNKKQQTVCPLVRNRNIPTDRPSLLREIYANSAGRGE
jgi:hypothetical protein